MYGCAMPNGKPNRMNTLLLHEKGTEFEGLLSEDDVNDCCLDAGESGSLSSGYNAYW